MIDDIKRKSFTASREASIKYVLTDDFMDTFIGSCREIVPPMKFLASAVGARW